jgi:hypothetical protein
MSPSRPRLAIPLTYGLSVRYLVSTGLLSQLNDVCEPVVAIGWDDPALVRRVEEAGAEAARLPDPHQSHEFRRIERLLDTIHQRRLDSPTTAITRRWRRQAQEPGTRLLTWLRQARDRLVTLRPGAEARLLAEEAASLEGHTNVGEYAAWLEEHRIDAVLTLTPYHLGDQLLLWAAAARGCRTASAVISFDNPTTRGRFPVTGERVLVWNQANLEEILRGYPRLGPDQVRVTGAPQFDLHRDGERIIPEPAWRERLGLPPGRPVILYGAVAELLVPDEELLVAAIDDAIGRGRIPGHPVVLLRGHPADPIERWAGAAALENVVVAPGWGRADGGLAWPSEEEIDLQMSTLAHADVQVSICSSMAIDGAAFDRPVITPTFVPGTSRTRQQRIESLYRQEHWQPIARSGGVTEVGDLTQLEQAVARDLAEPGRGREGRARLVVALLSFDDGKACERTTAAVEAFLREPPTDA